MSTNAAAKSSVTSLKSIFTPADVSNIDDTSQSLRSTVKYLEDMYWSKHKQLSTNSYKNTQSQHKDMVMLGTLAKAISDLRAVTGDVHCLGISAEAANNA